MWFISDNEKGKRDIQDCVLQALKNYRDKGEKIKSIEISKNNSNKGFTVEGIVVRVKNFIAKNIILLEFEKRRGDDVDGK